MMSNDVRSSLARNVKARIQHDRKWIMHNNSIELPNDIWRVVSDYWSEDPRIVDIIMLPNFHAFPINLESDEPCGPPHVFEIRHWWQRAGRWRPSGSSDHNRANLGMYIGFVMGDDLYSMDDDVMISLLIMPITMDDWSESENIGDMRGLCVIRDYLYRQLDPE